jgi:prephenate dehydrogenase
MSRITILGTGYIGTSIGLALKASKVNVEVIGHDRDLNRASEGRKRGAFDKVEWNLPAALEKASLVIVATPLGAMEKLFSQMVDFLEPGCIVTDTASLKGATLEWATMAFAGRASFVGGHPIVDGVDRRAAPTANLFQDRTYCVVAAANASEQAVDQVVRFVQTLGAKPLFIDPTEHDSHVAVTGQLPQLLAAALVRVAGASASWRDGQRLSGPAFATLTSAALEDPSELSRQFQVNRESLRRSLVALQDELRELADALDDPERFVAALTAAQEIRAALPTGTEPASELSPPTDLPRAREQFSSWFLGGLGGRRPKK